MFAGQQSTSMSRSIAQRGDSSTRRDIAPSQSFSDQSRLDSYIITASSAGRPIGSSRSHIPGPPAKSQGTNDSACFRGVAQEPCLTAFTTASWLLSECYQLINALHKRIRVLYHPSQSASSIWRRFIELRAADLPTVFVVIDNKSCLNSNAICKDGEV
jgi:hypothetical protein